MKKKNMQFMMPKANDAFSIAHVLSVRTWKPLRSKVLLPKEMEKKGESLDWTDEQSQPVIARSS